jgi:hypothetical protein
MTSPYFALHGVAPSYEHLCVFCCACYPILFVKAAHKLAPCSTRYIFLIYSADHKGYRCLDLTTNNIDVSQHVVFDEVDFPFSTSPHLTNNLDIFLQDDSPGAALMPALLSVPCVPPGFPPLDAAGGQTMPKTETGDQTTSGIEAGDQTTCGTRAGGPTARPCVATLSPASPTSVALMQRRRLRPRPTRCPRLQSRHVWPQCPQLRLRHPRLQRPSSTRCTIRVTLGLR